MKGSAVRVPRSCCVRGSAVPGSCCVKGSTVPRSCCVRGSAVPESCCVKGPVSWDDAVTGRPRVRCAHSRILLWWKGQLYLYLDPVVSEDQLYLDPVVLEDQLYLNPVVVKGSAVPGSCCGERISCNCTWILLCPRISCTWILLWWKDQLYLYLDPVVSEDQLYLDPVVVKGSAVPVPGSCKDQL